MLYENVPRYFEQHLEECRYPLLFSTKSLKCEQPEDVDCGERREYKDRCKYFCQLSKNETKSSQKMCDSNSNNN